MAISPTNKLVWLVKTIHKAGRITFKEIQIKWRDNEEMSGGVELPRRTFNNWIFAIWDMFGLDIRCEKCGDFPYYIANEEDMRNNSIENWLLNSYSVTNSLISSRAIKDKHFRRITSATFHFRLRKRRQNVTPSTASSRCECAPHTTSSSSCFGMARR